MSWPSPLITGLKTVNVMARSYKWQTCWKQSEPKICRLLQPRLQPLAANCRIPVCLWQHEPIGVLPQVQHSLTLMRRVYREQGKSHDLTEILLTHCDRLFVFSCIWSPYIAGNITITNLRPQTNQVKYNMSISPYEIIVPSLINVHRTNSTVAYFTLMIKFTILNHVFRYNVPILTPLTVALKYSCVYFVHFHLIHNIIKINTTTPTVVCITIYLLKRMIF